MAADQHTAGSNSAGSRLVCYICNYTLDMTTRRRPLIILFSSQSAASLNKRREPGKNVSATLTVNKLQIQAPIPHEAFGLKSLVGKSTA